MTTDNTFANWLRAHPAPDLQALVARHGGHHRVPPEIWAEFDQATAEWQGRRQRRLEDGPAEEIPRSDCSDPEALCICGLPGVVSRPRRGGGREIWRCEQHRNQWPEYAVGFALVSPDTESGE